MKDKLSWQAKLIGRMHDRRVTRVEVARELGVTKAYVTMILNGRRNPPNAEAKLNWALEKVLERRILNEHSADPGF